MDDELLNATSPSGRIIRYTYTARGQRATMTDPKGGVVNYVYDKDRNLVTLSDQRGKTTTWIYDELERVSSMIDPLGRTTTMSYDAMGNTTSTIDRMGRTTSITYDVLYRPTQIQYADATVTYSYDAAGRRTSVNDTHSGSITWTYDNTNRLLSETTSVGTVSYTYNSAGERITMTAADRPAVNYAYDTSGRPSTISQNLGQGLETFTYGYDILSRRTSLQRPNGVTTTYSYDEVSRLTQLKHQKGTDPAVEDFQYTFNADDEIASINSIYSSPLLPLEKTVSPADAANRIPNFGTATLVFNNIGETTSETDASGTANYQWDARGRLTQVTLPGSEVVSYTYDALGRRKSRTAGGITTTFLYDNQDIVLDIVSDGSRIDYLNGLSIDDKLRQSSTATGSLYFIQDNLRSTVVLTGATGSVSERIQYEAFGESGVSTLTRYLYTGRERDPLTGLIYYRARWYDPQQGRFLSEDPIRFNGGNNFYAYVNNNPLNFIDPNGLKERLPNEAEKAEIQKTLDKLNQCNCLSGLDDYFVKQGADYLGQMMKNGELIIEDDHLPGYQTGVTKVRAIYPFPVIVVDPNNTGLQCRTLMHEWYHVAYYGGDPLKVLIYSAWWSFIDTNHDDAENFAKRVCKACGLE
jgi:RHS repeat-associated protein